VFVQQVVKGNRIYCSTEALLSLSDRQNESFSEVMQLTVKFVSSFGG